MKTLARTLLVWFVLLAVPFQGFAAAAMRCAHGIGHAAAVAAPALPAAAHHGAEAVPPCHEAAQGMTQDMAQDHEAKAEQKQCGNCAACSVGAVIAPAFADAASLPFPRGPCPPANAARIAAFDPDLPERPPRPLLV